MEIKYNNTIINNQNVDLTYNNKYWIYTTTN